jgi:hypothetical protein
MMGMRSQLLSNAAVLWNPWYCWFYYEIGAYTGDLVPRLYMCWEITPAIVVMGRLLLQIQPGQLCSVMDPLDLYIWRVTVKSWDFAAEDYNWSWRLNMMWNATSLDLWEVIRQSSYVLCDEKCNLIEWMRCYENQKPWMIMWCWSLKTGSLRGSHDDTVMRKRQMSWLRLKRVDDVLMYCMSIMMYLNACASDWRRRMMCAPGVCCVILTRKWMVC